MSNSIILKEILDKISNISIRLDNIENDIKILKDDVKILKDDVKKLKEHRTEIKSYQLINSKSYEKEMTNFLYNYLISHNHSLFFYIPSNIEISRELFIINNSNKKKVLTDLDGIIVGTNNFHIKDCYQILKNEESMDDEQNIKCIKEYKNTISNNFNYDLHIIESKHNLDISKIKKKLRQVIKFKNLIENKNSSLNLKKFSKGSIYLYFATPILNKNVFDFINNKEYLKPHIWRNNKEQIKINDLDFLNDKIKFITKNEKEYNIL
jgi:hypothetical protein